MALNKIIFLGTGGDIVVNGKQTRASGGIIVIAGDTQLHIDPGPGALPTAAMANINLRATTSVLVSHNHIGHCNDVNAVLDAMTYRGLDRKGILVSNQTFINGSETSQSFLNKFAKDFIERIVVLEPEQKVGLENIEIKAIPAFHSDPKTIGFRIQAPEFTLCYSSDTGYSKELAKAYNSADVLILNTVLPSGETSENHLSADDAVKIIQEINPKLTIITHFGAKMLKADPLNEARRIQMLTNSQVIAAKDGSLIDLAYYSAKSKQKRLQQNF